MQVFASHQALVQSFCSNTVAEHFYAIRLANGKVEHHLILAEPHPQHRKCSDLCNQEHPPPPKLLLSKAEVESLIKPFTMEEFEVALKEMKTNTAPGPYGFLLEFYKQVRATSKNI